jgi:hypothetical protein
MVAHQRAIGMLCNEWADLEIAVAVLFIAVAKMPQDNFSLAICRTLAFRDMIDASKVAIISRFQNDAWIDAVKAELNYIDNDLRPERNRLVHDQWGLELGTPFQFHISPRLYKPKAGLHTHLEIARIYQPTAEQVHEIATEIKGSSEELDRLRMLVGKSDTELATSLAKQRKRLLPRPPEETTSRGGINVRVR